MLYNMKHAFKERREGRRASAARTRGGGGGTDDDNYDYYRPTLVFHSSRWRILVKIDPFYDVLVSPSPSSNLHSVFREIRALDWECQASNLGSIDRLASANTPRDDRTPRPKKRGEGGGGLRYLLNREDSSVIDQRPRFYMHRRGIFRVIFFLPHFPDGASERYKRPGRDEIIIFSEARTIGNIPPRISCVY